MSDCEAFRKLNLLMKALYYCSSPKHVSDRCYYCPFGGVNFHGGTLCRATRALAEYMNEEEH